MELDFKQIREIEFKILLAVDRVATALDIQYFLDFGTLLGARRHSGFIPWDDDIDIAMAPKSVEVLRENAFKILPHHLAVVPHPVFPSAVKVVDKRHLMLISSKLDPTGSSLVHPGIDIFPLSFYRKASRHLPTRFIGRLSQKRPTAKARARVLLGERSVQAIIFWLIAGVPQGVLRAYSKFIEYESGINWSNGSSGALLGHGLAMGTGTRNLPYSTVFPLRWIQFEGKKFLAPNDTDAYLTSLYGDWRQPVQYPQHFLRAWTE